MIESVTPQKALMALIAGGASHKSAQIRKATSYFLKLVVERMGPGRALSGVRDITDKIIPVTGQFLLDSNSETRLVELI